jgi:hypothetical protein
MRASAIGTHAVNANIMSAQAVDVQTLHGYTAHAHIMHAHPVQAHAVHNTGTFYVRYVWINNNMTTAKKYRYPSGFPCMSRNMPIQLLELGRYLNGNV